MFDWIKSLYKKGPVEGPVKELVKELVKVEYLRINLKDNGYIIINITEKNKAEQETLLKQVSNINESQKEFIAIGEDLIRKDIILSICLVIKHE